MKILVIEAYTAANIGSGALVEDSITLLKKRYPDAEMEILAQNPESIYNLTGLPTYGELITFPLNQPKWVQVLWLIRTSIWMFFHTFFSLLSKVGITVAEHLYTYNGNTKTALKKMQEADMVVSIGAERINDNFYKMIFFSLYILCVAKLKKKFLVLFPQTIGPFHFTVTRWLSAKVLSWCDMVYVRDQRSYDTVMAIGVKGNQVIRTCDVALIQPPVSSENAWKLLAEKGINKDENPLIAISVMQWFYFKAEGGSRYEDYCKAIAETADSFIENKKARIAFVATNVRVQGCRDDDIAAARAIKALMKHQESAFILDVLYSPSELKGVLGVMDLCIVTRMHACILGTSIHAPTMSINYQFKLKEYMQQMGLGDYQIDIDVVDAKSLMPLAEKAWADRDKIRAILEEKVAYWVNNLQESMAKLPDIK